MLVEIVRDMEMMNESIGIKSIVNPDGEKVEKGSDASDMDGYTVKSTGSKITILLCVVMMWRKGHISVKRKP